MTQFIHNVTVDDICVGEETYEGTYLDWLTKNDIFSYIWSQHYDPKKNKSYLTFRFRDEQNKVQFALRWA